MVKHNWGFFGAGGEDGYDQGDNMSYVSIITADVLG